MCLTCHSWFYLFSPSYHWASGKRPKEAIAYNGDEQHKQYTCSECYVSPKNRIGDIGEKKSKEKMTQMNWQNTLALQVVHCACTGTNATYFLYALVNWQRQLKTNWMTHRVFSFYDSCNPSMMVTRPDKTDPEQTSFTLQGWVWHRFEISHLTLNTTIFLC